MVCKKSVETVKSTFVDAEGIVSPPGIKSSVPPCFNKITIHYSFDLPNRFVRHNWQNTSNYIVPIGPLSKQSPTTKTCLFPHTMEVCHVWGMLWGNTLTGQLPGGWGSSHGEGGQCSQHAPLFFLPIMVPVKPIYISMLITVLGRMRTILSHVSQIKS